MRVAEPEIDQDNALAAADEVARLHVAVHDLLIMEILDGLAGLPDPAHHVADREALPALVPAQPSEVDPLDEAHDDVVDACGLFEVIHQRSQTRVAQLGEQSRLDFPVRVVARG